MRVLCNLPLECFEAREHFGDVEICTYGPRDRMLVDGVHFPFDVEFDPSSGSWHDLWQRLPYGFEPDFLLFWWPDQEPIPADLRDCPVPVVGIVSDYNLSLPYLAGTWPFFDVVLVDRAGVDLLGRLPFADVRHFCQYTFKRPFHRIFPGVARDIDIGFCGNLHPVVQRERMPWMDRLRALKQRGVRAEVVHSLHGEDYGRFLNRLRIGFNRSVRGEMNLRSFEVPACGALLFVERENLEVEDFFVPGEEVVLYGDDDFEHLVMEHLADEPRRAAMAAAAHEKVQGMSMGHRLGALSDLLQVPGPGRPLADAFDASYGRGVALLTTWTEGAEPVRELLRAVEMAPADPRPLNALALATLRWRGQEGADQAVQLLRKACVLSPSYLPAARNLVALLEGADREDLARPARADLDRRLSRAPDWWDVDGPLFPVGYTEAALTNARALADALRADDPSLLASG